MQATLHLKDIDEQPLPRFVDLCGHSQLNLLGFNYVCGHSEALLENVCASFADKENDLMAFSQNYNRSIYRFAAPVTPRKLLVKFNVSHYKPPDGLSDAAFRAL
jgi:hypothetical protein